MLGKTVLTESGSWLLHDPNDIPPSQPWDRPSPMDCPPLFRKSRHEWRRDPTQYRLGRGRSRPTRTDRGGATARLSYDRMRRPICNYLQSGRFARRLLINSSQKNCYDFSAKNRISPNGICQSRCPPTTQLSLFGSLSQTATVLLAIRFCASKCTLHNDAASDTSATRHMPIPLRLCHISPSILTCQTVMFRLSILRLL